VVSFNAVPATDDRPFFFVFERGLPLMLLSLLLVFGGLLVAALRNCPPVEPERWAISLSSPLLIFAALGVGFMLVEVTTIRRFTLFLGYPTLSLSVTLFSLLLAGGVGSRLSQRFSSKDLPTVVALAALAVSFLSIAYIRLVPWLTGRFLAADLPVRMLITVVLILPLGLALGIPFPATLRFLAALQKGHQTAWAWGINGLASVFGSVLAVAVAILGGFSWTSLISGLIYLAVFVVSILGWRRSLWLTSSVTVVSNANLLRSVSIQPDYETG